MTQDIIRLIVVGLIHFVIAVGLFIGGIHGDQFAVINLMGILLVIGSSWFWTFYLTAKGIDRIWQ